MVEIPQAINLVSHNPKFPLRFAETLAVDSPPPQKIKVSQHPRCVMMTRRKAR